jgi:cell division protein FtsB
MMSPPIVTALAGLSLTAFVQIAGLLIWGASLTQRVRRLEDEIRPLRALPEKLARLEVRLDALFEQMRELNASIRWMREPMELPSFRRPD